MKKLLSVILLLALIFTAASAADSTETETERTETLPADTDGAEDLTRTFLNINIWLFSAAAALLVICTAGAVIFRIKKKRSA